MTETNNTVCISWQFPMDFFTFCSSYNVVGIFVRLFFFGWPSLGMVSFSREKITDFLTARPTIFSRLREGWSRLCVNLQSLLGRLQLQSEDHLRLQDASRSLKAKEELNSKKLVTRTKSTVVPFAPPFWIARPCLLRIPQLSTYKAHLCFQRCRWNTTCSKYICSCWL